MKYLFSFFLIFPLALVAQEKECDCIDVLEEISSIVSTSKSYKDQIKNNQAINSFKSWEESIKLEIKGDPLIEYFCTGYVQKYLKFIKDNHNGLFLNTEKYKPKIPLYENAIDTMEVLSDVVVGFYNRLNTRIYVTKVSSNSYFGVVVKSKRNLWKNGTIRLKINRLENGLYEIFEFNPGGSITYKRNIEISDGRIEKTYWSKSSELFFRKAHKENFEFRELNSNFDYIAIKSLKGLTTLRNERKQFIDSLKSFDFKQNMIVDLRNNSGGSTEQIEPFIKLLKGAKSVKSIYVLINHKTGSAAEIGAYSFSKDQRVRIVGENSKGSLTYGYGEKAISGETKCLNFTYQMSSDKGNRKLIRHEVKGITPDIYLTNSTDWIKQILELH